MLSVKGICKSVLSGAMLLGLAHASALGQEACAPEGRGTYVGVFGGGGGSHFDSVNQVGTALFADAAGGPLGVNAQGSGDSHGVGLVGLHIGREWSGWWVGDNGWALLPAAEFEGFYFGGTQDATVSDPANRLNGHVFETSYPMDNGAFLTNVVLSLHNPSAFLSPYVGLGVGAACISISGADSLQVVPPEPGVNHFNSDTSSSSWGFAAQVKIGARIPLGERAYVFAEYRYLFVGSTTQTFGSTVAPGHVPTTPWTVHFGDMNNHTAVGGIGFRF